MCSGKYSYFPSKHIDIQATSKDRRLMIRNLPQLIPAISVYIPETYSDYIYFFLCESPARHILIFNPFIASSRANKIFVLSNS